MLGRPDRRRFRGVAGILLLALLPLACGDPASTPDAAPDGAAPNGASAQTYAANGALLRSVSLPARPPNLIVIVLDAVRGDALEDADDTAPAGAAPRMPFLSSLADQGIRFTNATASAPWTLPSMVSLLTGMLPSQHGQCQPDGGWPLPDAITTLPEVLQHGYGYETAAFLNGLWFQRDPGGLLQGFAKKRTSFALQGLAQDVGNWNRKRDRERPFFLLLHTYEPHDPYGEKNHPWPPIPPAPAAFDPLLLQPGADPAEIFRLCFLDAGTSVALGKRMGIRLRDTLQRYKFSGYREHPRPEIAEELRTAYWEGVRWVDGLLEQAYGRLDAMGLLENTLLVVTSDHGEAFGEHGNLGHGLCLYDDLLQVPLVMTGPAPFRGGHVIDEQIALIDVLPTFLDWTGMLPLLDIVGRSALGIVEGEPWCRPVFSEEPLSRANTGEDRSAVRLSARTPEWKYIVELNLRTGEAREEAYDLLVDPEELSDLAEGTGRLPEYLLLDACMCASVEALRGRVWPDLPTGASDSEGAVYTTPYGAGTNRAASGRPPPCRAGP